MKTEIKEYGPSIIRHSPASIRILLKSHNLGATFFYLLSIY